MLLVQLTNYLYDITNKIAGLTTPGNYTRIDLGIDNAQSQFTTGAKKIKLIEDWLSTAVHRSIPSPSLTLHLTSASAGSETWALELKP